MSLRARAAGESIGFLLIITGIFIALNIIGVFLFVRGDLTENNQFTLSESSRRVARELQETLSITAYITEDLPNPMIDRNIRDILVEYEQASEGRIELRIVNPDERDEQREAGEHGLEKRQFQEQGEEEASAKLGYRDIVLQMFGETKIIPVGMSTAGLEYELTRSMMILAGEKRKIGIVSGHMSELMKQVLPAYRQELPLYEIEEVSATSEIDSELVALLVLSPDTPFTETELRYINQYVMRGGSLGIFGGGLKVGDFQTMLQAESLDSGLNSLLSPWGVEINQRPVIDRVNYGLLPNGPFRVPYIAAPAVPVDEAVRDHPITFGLRFYEAPWTSSLTIADDESEGIEVTVLGVSSDEIEDPRSGRRVFGSWTPEQDPLDLNPRTQEQIPPPASDDDTGPFELMAAIEGELPSAFPGTAASTSPEEDPPPDIEAPERSEGPVRVLVSASYGLPLTMQWGGQVFANGRTVLLNSIDWLANETDLVEIRAKDVEPASIVVPTAITEQEEAAQDAITDAQLAAARGEEEEATEAAERAEAADERRREEEEKWRESQNIYRWGNTLGIPLLVAIIGVIRWQVRVAKKKNVSL